jgi:hypothetical protein
MFVLFFECELIVGPRLEVINFDNEIIVDFEQMLILGFIFLIFQPSPSLLRLQLPDFLLIIHLQ